MTIYEADWIVPVTAPAIQRGAIAVDNGRISALGTPDALPGSHRVRFPGCAIIPGFVNAHTHLELTILRGFLENMTFTEWIRELVRAKYQSLSRDALKLSAQLGASEMLRAGVTCVGEVMDVGTAWDAMRESGLQGIAYQETFGPSDTVAAESLASLKQKIELFRPDEHSTLRVGVSPHAPYTVSKTLYEMTRDYARSEGLRMTVHIAESHDESLFVRDGSGPFGENHRGRAIDVTPRHCTPIAYLDSLGLLGPDMLAIHAIETDDADLERLGKTKTFVVHCPKSNAKLGHRTARVEEMRARGISLALGTDSVASNNVVDMFEEMRAAVFQQRTLTGNIRALSAQDAFRMATIGGARALGLDDSAGSLENGKRADFVVVDLSGVATQPVFDPVESLVYSASRRDVRKTFIGGREVDLDDSEILRETAVIAARLRLQQMG